ncbi:MAG TPA: DUF2799 domain-containing protein [Burkholderiales bacterium]|nr:DUF2799 domain-containing protein [Burkholderiales bacterium]
MRSLLAIAFVSLATAACASMDATECRGANWYEIGFRDGLFGMQRMDFVYTEQCGKHGVKLDAAAYAKGWQEGVWEYDKRKIHGGTD